MMTKKHISCHDLIFWLIFFLTGFGLLMSLSTTATTYFTMGSTLPFREFTKQALFALVGFALMLMVSRLPSRFWKKMALPFFLISCGLLVLVLIPPFYVEGIYNEAGEAARRWLRAGFFSFQPSELAKFGLILMVSYLMSLYKGKMKLGDFFKVLLWVMIPVFLVYVAPDFSTAVFLLLLGLIAMVIGGTPIKYFVLTMIPVLIGGVAVLSRSDRLMGRIISYHSVFKDPANSGYQVLQSFIAIARGGWLGQGLNRGSQKFYSLPEAQTDFVFAVICEEFGLLVSFFVIFAFCMFLYLAISVSLKSKDSFSSILSAMIGLHLFLQAMLHIAVTLGIAPPTGIPLPFISIGGTALVVYLVEVGVLMKLARKAETVL